MTRISIQRHYAAMQPLIKLGEEIRARGHLDAKLADLILMRCSQINGCAFCLDMHSRDARRLGETEQRLYLLNAWHESPLYSERERAALAWTDALTLIAETHAPDAEYEAVRKNFSEVEIVNLTILIGLINLWNRLSIGLRTPHALAKAKAA